MKKMKKSALAAAVLLSLNMMGASVEASEGIYNVPILIEDGSTFEIHEPQYTGVKIEYDLPEKDTQSAVIKITNGVLDIDIPDGSVSLTSTANVTRSLMLYGGKAVIKSNTITMKRKGGGTAIQIGGVAYLDANTILFDSDNHDSNECGQIDGGLLYVNQNIADVTGTTVTTQGRFNVKNGGVLQMKAETMNLGNSNGTQPFLVQTNAKAIVEGKTINFVAAYLKDGINGIQVEDGGNLTIKGLDGINSVVNVMKQYNGELADIYMGKTTKRKSLLTLKGNGANLIFNSGKIHGNGDVEIDFANSMRDTLQITSTSFDDSKVPVKIDLDIDLTTPANSDTFKINGDLSTGVTFNLNRINLLNGGNVTEYQLVTVTGDGIDKVKLDGTVTIGDSTATYTFTDKGSGWLNIEHGAGVDLPAAIKEESFRDYTLLSDYEGTKALGELEGENRDFKVNGRANVLKGNDNTGVTVTAGQTMTFSDFSEISGWSNVVNNAGTVNFENVENLHNDFNNTGVVNVNGTTDFKGNVTGDTGTGDFGTVNFNGDVTIGSPVTVANNVKFGANSKLNLDASKFTESAAISGVKSATADSTSKLYLNNVTVEKEYKILAGEGISIGEDWVEAVYGLITTVTTDANKYNVTFSVDEEFVGNLVDIPNVYKQILSDTSTDAYKWADAVSQASGSPETAANVVNTVANMSAVAGVQSGTASMMNSMANNLSSNLGSSARPNMIADRGGLRNTATDNGEVKIDTVEVGKAANVMPERYLAKAYNKEVWASYIHSKQHVDGLKAGMLDNKSVNQYNGVTVGADLWSGKHSFGGVALSYADGNVNAGNLRNDTDYYGVSIYNRHDYKGLTMLTDVSYTHSKNDINISGVQEITADAKADAIGVGVRFETPVTMGKTTVTPYAGARYTYLKNKDYDNNLGMNYDTDDQNLVTIPVGLEISAEFAMPKSDWTFRPVLEGGYVWNLGDRDGNTKIGYMGAYDSVGFETSDPGQYFIRAAMQFAKADFTCEVGYRYSKGKSVRDNRWNVNLNYAF